MTKDHPHEFRPLGSASGGETDYSGPGGDDFESLSRDRGQVRSLSAEDFDAVARIDRKITGEDRSSYLQRKFDEALNESAIRVSLIAEIDGKPAGIIMARVDFGDFGQTEPVASLDTLGIDPDFAGRGIGKALLSQLLANLAALRVERVETQLAREDFELLGFLYHCGFAPAQTLAFHKTVR